MRYFILLALCLTGCLRREPAIPETDPPMYVPETLTKHEPYQNVELYEYRKRWLLPNTYSRVQVPVTRPGRLDALFTEERELYRKEGGDYKPYKVLVVRMEEYRKKEIRRAKLQDNMQFFLIVGAGIGVLGIIAGLIARYYQQPYWDELVVSGVIVSCFGLAGAWWVEQLPYIAAGGVLCMIASTGYSIYRKKQVVSQKDQEQFETVTAMEQLKMLARPTWERIRDSVEQSDSTEAAVARVKEKAKEIAADRLSVYADLVQTVRAPVVVPEPKPVKDAQ